MWCENGFTRRFQIAAKVVPIDIKVAQQIGQFAARRFSLQALSCHPADLVRVRISAFGHCPLGHRPSAFDELRVIHQHERLHWRIGTFPTKYATLSRRSIHDRQLRRRGGSLDECVKSAPVNFFVPVVFFKTNCIRSGVSYGLPQTIWLRRFHTGTTKLLNVQTAHE